MATPRDDESPNSPEEWMREALGRLFSGDGQFDPEELAKAAGFSGNPDELIAMMDQVTRGLSQAMSGSEKQAVNHAVDVAKKNATALGDDDAKRLGNLISVGTLWVGEVTDIPPPDTIPLLMGRGDWARVSFPVWQEMADPVAASLAGALGDMMGDHGPEELAELLEKSRPMLTQLGTNLFRIQLAGVVGTLATEVLSAGDVGIPLIQAETEGDVRAGLLPQNMAEFGSGLEIPADEVDLYIIVRELAHQRLFRQARWLRAHLMSLLGDYARGIRIDGDRMIEIAEGIDPTNPEELQRILASGALIPERTEQQERALERLETMLALIEGWVDHITALATTRLPSAGNVQEAIRRRRASGGPAEHAFKTLVGLELRPRRLREAAALWQAIFDAAGSEVRDSLWEHPDVVPDANDIDNPAECVARILGKNGGETDVDKLLDDIFGSDNSSDGDADTDPDASSQE